MLKFHFSKGAELKIIFSWDVKTKAREQNPQIYTIYFIFPCLLQLKQQRLYSGMSFKYMFFSS
jgi:hypothetical protein